MVQVPSHAPKRHFKGAWYFGVFCAALHFMYYDFCLKHGTLGSTPAQALGIASQKWSLEDVVGLIESN